MAERSPLETAEVPPAQRLCMSCGFCCDGTLFPALGVGPSDSPQFLVSIGLTPVPRPDLEITAFSLPCSQFRGACSVYRLGIPEACANYRCGLLKALDDGRRSLEEALETVRVAKSLHSAVPPDIDGLLREADPGYEGITMPSHAIFLNSLPGLPDAAQFLEKHRAALNALREFGDCLSASFHPGS